jgi:hypothetical protein
VRVTIQRRLGAIRAILNPRVAPTLHTVVLPLPILVNGQILLNDPRLRFLEQFLLSDGELRNGTERQNPGISPNHAGVSADMDTGSDVLCACPCMSRARLYAVITEIRADRPRVWVPSLSN